jgi:hypothetical protein
MKSATAAMIAAAIAAAVTILTAPSAPVTAGPLPHANAAAMHACSTRPWPYLGCVGTPYGKAHVRLVSTERLAD